MKTNEEILLLITARLHGTASQQQEEQLQQWIEASPANREEYETYTRIWEESGASLRAHPFDTNAAWLKVERRLSPGLSHPNKPTHAGRSTVIFLKRLAVAASLILLVGTGYYLLTKSSSTQTIASEQNKSVVLPDGSVVTLRKGSSLIYGRQFNQHERTVQLDGEAFFQVAHNEQRPFLVLTPQVQVRVTGTSFLVRSGQAMEEVMVASGKVMVTDRKKKNGLQLVAGQRAILHSNQLEQMVLTDSNYIAWKTGVLNFSNASLAKVLEDIEQYYAVPVKAGGPDSAALKQTTITVHFENQPLEQVLDELQLITGLQARKENGVFILYKK